MGEVCLDGCGLGSDKYLTLKEDGDSRFAPRGRAVWFVWCWAVFAKDHNLEFYPHRVAVVPRPDSAWREPGYLAGADDPLAGLMEGVSLEAFWDRLTDCLVKRKRRELETQRWFD